MSISMKQGREWLNENSAIVTIVTVVGLILVLAYLLSQARGPSFNVEYKPRPVWFYDLNTGETFEMQSDTIPPIETDSGPFNNRPAGVLKRVFSCDQCQSDFQFYLMAYLPEAQEARRELDAWMMRKGERTPEEWNQQQKLQETASRGIIVARPSKPGHWVLQSSAEGLAIITEVEYHCDEGGRAMECFPD